MWMQLSRFYQIERVEELQDEEELSEEERAAIKQWVADYKNWKERRAAIDPVTTRRYRDASLNLAMILIGLPLYLYHWRIIKRETQKQKKKKVRKDN